MYMEFAFAVIIALEVAALLVVTLHEPIDRNPVDVALSRLYRDA
jgi:hypothetical protein